MQAVCLYRCSTSSWYLPCGLRLATRIGISSTENLEGMLYYRPRLKAITVLFIHTDSSEHLNSIGTSVYPLVGVVSYSHVASDSIRTVPCYSACVIDGGYIEVEGLGRISKASDQL